MYVFIKAAGDVLPPDPSLAEGVVIMSDYELLMIILTFGLLIVAIIDLTHKK